MTATSRRQSLLAAAALLAAGAGVMAASEAAPAAAPPSTEEAALVVRWRRLRVLRRAALALEPARGPKLSLTPILDRRLDRLVGEACAIEAAIGRCAMLGPYAFALAALQRWRWEVGDDELDGGPGESAPAPAFSIAALQLARPLIVGEVAEAVDAALARGTPFEDWEAPDAGIPASAMGAEQSV